MENKKVCLIGSLSSKDVFDKAIKTFEELGMDVHHPFLNQEGSLLHIQKEYLKAIEEADLICVVPKIGDIDERVTAQTVVKGYIGESTSYEMAFAMYLKKPIIVWGGGN